MSIDSLVQRPCRATGERRLSNLANHQPQIVAEPVALVWILAAWPRAALAAPTRRGPNAALGHRVCNPGTPPPSNASAGKGGRRVLHARAALESFVVGHVLRR